MSDPPLRRQQPTDAPLISNGDADMALHLVDRLEAKIDRTTIGEVIDALRYWIGEADHLRAVAGERDAARADAAALRARVAELEKSAHESSGQEGKLAHALNQAQGRVAELEALLREVRQRDRCVSRGELSLNARIDAALAGGKEKRG